MGQTLEGGSVWERTKRCENPFKGRGTRKDQGKGKEGRKEMREEEGDEGEEDGREEEGDEGEGI